METATLTKTRIQAGTYEGVLKAGGEGTYSPDIAVLHLEQEPPKPPGYF